MEGTGSSVGGMSSGSVDLDPGVDITHLEGRLASCDRQRRFILRRWWDAATAPDPAGLAEAATVAVIPPGHATAETRAPFPVGWERVWSGDQGAHFFWHSASRTACWTLDLAAAADAAEGDGDRDGHVALDQGLDFDDYGDIDAWAAVPPGHATPATRAPLPAGWERVWSEEHGASFFWHPASRLARWTLDLAAAAQALDPPPWLRPAPAASSGLGVPAQGPGADDDDDMEAWPPAEPHFCPDGNHGMLLPSLACEQDAHRDRCPCPTASGAEWARELRLREAWPPALAASRGYQLPRPPRPLLECPHLCARCGLRLCVRLTVIFHNFHVCGECVYNHATGPSLA